MVRPPAFLQKARRPDPQSGIAIGVILFALALIAAIAIAISASGNFVGSTLSTDRVSAEVKSQADLIRTKITECYMNVSSNVNAFNPATDYNSSNYPASTGNGTLVENLDCPTYNSGAQNLWTGQSRAFLPAPPAGFDKWVYVNASDTGGRCIRIQPTGGNATDKGIRQGLIEATGAFSGMEAAYDTNSASQRFIIWITRPTGAASTDCSS